MASAFGNQGDHTSPPSGANTEFERSISRSVEAEDTPPAGLREKIGEDVDTVKQAAQDATRAVSDKAAELAERQKGFAADQISKIAHALERVGEEMQSEQPGPVGDYTKRLGASARDFAERVQDKDIGEIAAIAEDFGRRQPLAFLGLAAIAGLAASRFITASANRPSGTAPAGTYGGSNQFADTKESYNG